MWGVVSRTRWQSAPPVRSPRELRPALVLSADQACRRLLALSLCRQPSAFPLGEPPDQRGPPGPRVQWVLERDLPRLELYPQASLSGGSSLKGHAPSRGCRGGPFLPLPAPGAPGSPGFVATYPVSASVIWPFLFRVWMPVSSYMDTSFVRSEPTLVTSSSASHISRDPVTAGSQ